MLSFDPSAGLIVPGGPQSFRPCNFAVPFGLRAYYGLSSDCLDFTNNLAKNIAYGVDLFNQYMTNLGLASTSGVYASGYTVISRNSAFVPNDIVTNLQIYSTTAFTGKLKIMRRNGALDYTLIQEQAISHGGTGWENFTLSPSFTVPSTGSHYVGIYTATSPTGTASQNRSYHSGDVGTSNTGWAEDTNISFGARYNLRDLVLTGDATLNNFTASSLIHGITGQGLKFNGSSSYIDFTTAGSSSTPGIWNADIMSFSMWMLDTGTAPSGENVRYIISRGPFATVPYLGVYYYQSNMGMSINGILSTLCALTDLKNGDHLCWTFKFPNWAFYKNAVRLSSGTSATHFNYIGAAAPKWVFGRQGDYGIYYWDGAMNEARFYDRELDQNEVNDIYVAGLAGRRNALNNYSLFLPMMNLPPSFIPAWAQQSNLPVIGAGTF